MSTIKIEGTFNGSINNFVQIDIYRPNLDSYNFSKQYHDDFSITLTDLTPGHSYFFDVSGFTAGEFMLETTGDIEAPISDQFQGSFQRGFVITTDLSTLKP